MNKMTRVGLLPAPTFAGMGLSGQAKNQHFSAFSAVFVLANQLSSYYRHKYVKPINPV